MSNPLSLAAAATLAWAPAQAVFAPSFMPSHRLVRMTADLQTADNEQPAVAAPPPPKLPAIQTMQVGDNTLAGDANFDPLGLAENPGKLAFYREAEVKHARLAMLAAVGWPIAEKLNGALSSMLNVPSLLQDGRAPSILNGGLGQVNPLYWAAVLGLAVFVESKTIDNQLDIGKRNDDYLPGMLEYDFLGMDSPAMRGAEIINGRVAMVAITAYALEEAIFKAPIVAETSFLFQPFWN